ncbi:MAG TPA: TonB family protein [Candidatus Solibacter sp.]|nr:TonB family protein [Candidatus Solibacter sp.]
MATVGPRPEDDQLQLLTEWNDAFTRPRQKRAAVASAMVHLAVVALLLLMPGEVLVRPPEPPPPEPKKLIFTPLVEPPTEFTQKAPNKGKVSHEIDIASLQPRAKVQAPQGPPPAPRGNTPRPPAPLPPAPAPKSPAPGLPEPPKVEAVQRETPKIDLPPSPSTVQLPQAPTVEKPKLAFENVGGPPPPVPPGQSRVPIPSGSVADTIHTMRGGTGGAAVGDTGALPGMGEGGINQPAGIGVPGSALQLKSDPLGVDFQPYLKQILLAIRTNWMAVYPESARLGRRGRVTLAFIILKNGRVDKVAMPTASGTDALDRASIAAVSASNPFPPLPADFKGDKIVLEVNFVYNMPKR